MPTCPTCRTRYEGATVCPKDGEPLLDDAAFTNADVDLEPGTVVGEYRIEAKLGEGGFGSVYRAVHPLIGKTAAIKVLNRQYSSNPQMVSRFIAEARAVNQIRHRNIIDIFSFGALEDGRHYYVMELLDGMPFDQYLAERGRLPIQEAVPILRSIGRALDAAHAAGIAHRDLKPENIFLVFDEDGGVFPKLLDFGIAKLLTDSISGGHKTRTGTPMGTPYYMSPEQCRGKNIDHRTDVYSFGVLVHKVLTGRLPFEGDDVIELLFKQTTAAPPPMSSVRADLPASLDGPVLHMLEKDPDKRPQTLTSAVDELAQAAQRSGVPVMHTPGIATGRASVRVADARTPSPTELEQARTVAGDTAKTFRGAETDVGAEPKKRVALLVGVGLLALAAIAGGIAISRGGPEVRTPTTSQPAALTTEAPQPVPPAPAPSASAPSVTPAPVVDVDVTVQATPPNAEVYEGSEKLGTAPGPFKLKRGDARVKLTVKADGYKPTDVEVTPSANAVVQVTLAKNAVAAPKKKSELENPF